MATLLTVPDSHGLAQGLLRRYRLHNVLAGRFDRALTVLVAGSGWGKSTLLRQVLSAEDVEQLDRSHAIQPGDRHFSEFAGAMRLLLGLEGAAPADPDTEAAMYAEAIAAMAPAQVCVTLDDLDKLEGGPGLEFLARLLDVLPPNGHLVLAARAMPDLPLSRYVADGRAVMLSEADLAFTDDEWQVFARSRGIDDAVEAVRWPALARLVVEGSPRVLVRSHLMHEIVRHLSERDREVLGAVVAIGHSDDEIVSAVLGRQVRLEDRMGPVALVDQTTAGDWVAHALWTDVLEDVLEPAKLAEIRSAAATVLGRRGQFAAAMRLAVTEGDWPLAERLAIAALADQPPAVAMDVLASWQNSVPEHERRRPVWRLVDALVSYEHSLPAARALITSIVDDLAAGATRDNAESPGLQIAVLFHLATIGRRTADQALLIDVADRLEPLATPDNPRATAVLASVLGFLDQIHGRTRQGLARFDDVELGGLSPEQASHLLMMEGNLLLLDGQVETALANYARASELGSSPVRLLARELWATACWVAGRLEESIAVETECLETATRMGLDGRAAQFKAMLAAQHAMIGHYDAARQILHGLDRRDGSRSPDTETRALTLQAVALLALVDGELPASLAAIGRIPPLQGNLQRALVLPIAAMVALTPSRRDEAASLRAPLVRRAVELGMWLHTGSDQPAYPRSPTVAALAPLVLRENAGHYRAEIERLTRGQAAPRMESLSASAREDDPPAGLSDGDLARLGLTRRQLEVLIAVRTGATNAEIARGLHISTETVKKHLENAYERLDVTGRAQATARITELLAQRPSSSTSAADL